MKRIVYSVLGVVFACVLLGICYYLSFRNALLHYNREAIQENNELLGELLEYTDSNYELLKELSRELKQEAVSVATKGDTILPTAIYYLETYDTLTQTMTKEELPLPGFMVGLKREELDTFLKGYMENLPVNDFLSGMIAFEIVSFSEKEVVLRKTYAKDIIEYQFYICNRKGFVTVFYSDLKTVYEYTEIACETLSPEIQEQLQNGFYIKDAKELYGILEGYTS